MHAYIPEEIVIVNIQKKKELVTISYTKRLQSQGDDYEDNLSSSSSFFPVFIPRIGVNVIGELRVLWNNRVI